MDRCPLQLPDVPGSEVFTTGIVIFDKEPVISGNPAVFVAPAVPVPGSQAREGAGRG